MSTKEISFKNLLTKEGASTIPVGQSFLNPNTLRANLLKMQDSEFRLNQIRKKYDSPGMRKSLKISQFSKDYKDQMNSSKVESFAIQKQCFIDSKEQFRGYYPRRKHVTEQSEEVLFIITSMKESLLEDRQNVSFGRLKGGKERNQRYQKQQGQEKSTIAREENIDKINSKIKQILSCLQDNEQHTENKLNMKMNSPEHFNQKFESKHQTTTNFYDREFPQFRRNKNMHEDKQNRFLDAKEEKPKTQPISRQNLNANLEKMFSIKINAREAASKQETEEPRLYRNDSFSKNLDRPNKDRVRSKSYVQINQGSFNRKDRTFEEDQKKSEKTDGRIMSIQKKIQQFQDAKRRLNIDFKPFTYERKDQKPIKYFNQYQQPKNKTEILSRQNVGVFLEKPIEQSQLLTGTQNHSTNRSSVISQPFNKEVSINEFKLKMNNDESNERSALYAKEIQFRKSIDSNQQLRRRKLSAIPLKTQRCSQIESLVGLFASQVELDETLRNAKCWFANQYGSDKWKILYEQLERQGIELNEQDSKLIFSSSEQENNPFFSVRQFKETTTSLVAKRQLAEEHWIGKVKNKVFSKGIQRDQLIQQIDLENKGHIILEDFVRFLNIETKKFYRNRDLILIFKRLTSERQIGYKEFESALIQL